MTEPHFDVEPWGVSWSGFDLERLQQAESVFALSNGTIGWRANLDEGEPDGTPGSYLNGLFERWPLAHAEDGYGFPDEGESIINAPDGKIMRLFVDGAPVDVRVGEVRRHWMRLDFRSGVLRRELEWVSPEGRGIRLACERLVSLTEPAVAALRYEVEALQPGTRVSVQSELRVGEQDPAPHDDPRATRALEHPLVAVAHEEGHRPVLVHRTRESDIAVVAAVEHRVAGADRVDTDVTADVARVTARAQLDPGDRLLIDKLTAMACGPSTPEGPRATVDAALDRACELGWEGLAERQREYLDDFWEAADIEIAGDERLQQGVRFCAFHTLQASARADGGPIPNKGLTGRGYEGHAFWETEIFVVPVLNYLLPQAAENALRWRHSTLPEARRRAAQLRQAGAVFAWRTISGRETSGYWPASTAAFHLGADMAHAVVQHLRVTGDREFEREVGLELLVETARLWIALGRWDDEGGFHIDGVTGPDEYTALVDDNTYTNLMAQQNLRAAADATGREPQRAHELGVQEQEPEEWRRAAEALTIPWDERRGIHPQARGFTEREEWDFEATPAENYPLQLHHPYFELYRTQVVKQPDLVLAMYLRGEEFTREQKARNFAYYEARTVRDSSLAASTCSVLAAELGHLELALDYLREGALLDLDDLHRSTSGGLHLGCLAGVWSSVVAGFGGLRWHDDGPAFSPQLPPEVSRLTFGLRIGTGILRVELVEGEARYLLSGAESLRIRHHGTEATVEEGRMLALPLPPVTPVGAAPRQPAGRSPHELLRHG
ncbi:family 65 glycosyl hydrolase [Salinibacterium sp. SYSU T00001]|uniref:glycoside hydrolase family 65 protein n=1 Tax=Homoserinimonas sedimenticola TaxID=2986805 RepID=UPI0022358FA7|nr:glycosyl hydrolase family 65 protein [Salinibacterium sedimenticola]MCW4386101.1 family 65 glycosyl hydrolase [Salinibacterium sedimenticola]